MGYLSQGDALEFAYVMAVYARVANAVLETPILLRLVELWPLFANLDSDGVAAVCILI